MTTYYHKLIRDNIPKIMFEKGVKYRIQKLDDDKMYAPFLMDKLCEESHELYENPSKEEMADILEVVYEMFNFYNYNYDEVEKIRVEKRKERGAFKNRTILILTED